MELLFSELKRLLGLSDLADGFWILRRQFASIQGTIVQLPLQLGRIERMASEVQEALESLRSDVRAEKAEVLQKIDAQSELIAALEAKISEGEDPTETLAEIKSIAEEVRGIVSTEAVPEEPTEV